MAMLHTINKSPFERNTLDTCLRIAKKGGSILLIEDGVYGAMQGTAMADKITQVMREFSIYVLGPDVKARGIKEDRLVKGVKVIDYYGFVDLVAEHENVQTWL